MQEKAYTLIWLALFFLFVGLFFYISPFLANSPIFKIDNAQLRSSVTALFKMGFLVLTLFASYMLMFGDKK